MKHYGILLRLIFIALVCAVLGFAAGYERGVADAKDFVLERVGNVSR